MLTVAYLDGNAPGLEGFIAAGATYEDYRSAERFRLNRGRRHCLMARVLLRTILARVTGFPGGSWRIDTDARGKPRAWSESGSFGGDVTLSHSRDMAAVAVADDGLVGIDIEYCDGRRRFAAIATAAFGPAERQAVAAGGPAAFYRIWTLREALAKATGAGMAMVIDGRDYVAGIEADGRCRASIDDRSWLFANVSLPGPYALSVVAASDCDAVTIESLILRG